MYTVQYQLSTIMHRDHKKKRIFHTRCHHGHATGVVGKARGPRVTVEVYILITLATGWPLFSPGHEMVVVGLE